MLVKTIFACLMLVAAAGAADEAPVHLSRRITGEEFAKETKKGITLIFNYVSWCEHQAKWITIINELYDKYKNNPDIDIFRVDCEKELDRNSYICFQEGVEGFPALLLYKEGEFAASYTNNRDIKLLDQFINAYKTPAGAAAYEKKEAARLKAKEEKKAKAAAA